jgi:hypothetical protein
LDDEAEKIKAAYSRPSVVDSSVGYSREDLLHRSLSTSSVIAPAGAGSCTPTAPSTLMAVRAASSIAHPLNSSRPYADLFGFAAIALDTPHST